MEMKAQLCALLALTILAQLSINAKAQSFNRQGVRYAFTRSNFLGRSNADDELSTAAVTPYPSAEDLKPAIPFDDTNEQQEPAGLPASSPDEVYGPPAKADRPEVLYGTPLNTPMPDIIDNDLAIDSVEPESEAFPPSLDGNQARYIAAVQRQRLRRQRQYNTVFKATASLKRRARPAKLRNVLRIRRLA